MAAPLGARSHCGPRPRLISSLRTESLGTMTPPSSVQTVIASSSSLTKVPITLSRAVTRIRGGPSCGS